MTASRLSSINTAIEGQNLFSFLSLFLIFVSIYAHERIEVFHTHTSRYKTIYIYRSFSYIYKTVNVNPAAYNLRGFSLKNRKTPAPPAAALAGEYSPFRFCSMQWRMRDSDWSFCCLITFGVGVYSFFCTNSLLECIENWRFQEIHWKSAAFWYAISKKAISIFCQRGKTTFIYILFKISLSL